MKYVAFASCGKDSTYMIDLLIQKNKPIDEIVFIKNEKEFKIETSFRKKLIARWEKYAKCVVLQTEDKWDRWFYGEVTRGKHKGLKRGFPLHGVACYWTRESKVKVIEKYLKNIKEDYVQYIGYTTNEKSHKRKNIKIEYKLGMRDKSYRYPLIDWNITEQMCYDYCNKNGVLNPLYNHFKRAGCYLCPNQDKESLIELCRSFPKEWNELMSYLEDTYSDSFVKQGWFNRRINLEDIYEIHKLYYKGGK